MELNGAEENEVTIHYTVVSNKLKPSAGGLSAPHRGDGTALGTPLPRSGPRRYGLENMLHLRRFCRSFFAVFDQHSTANVYRAYIVWN